MIIPVTEVFHIYTLLENFTGDACEKLYVLNFSGHTGLLFL